MIEWMQTHRKWLVVTIWIATIAFIGAGFVGWGQFQLSRKESVVAQVKDTEVTIKDWQRYYNLIYNEVNQQLNGNLDEATAKKLGLKKIALQRAIRGAILIQFAKDLGLYVTDEDVAKEILKIFKTKQNYLTSLKRNNLTPKDFEDGLKKEILVQKLLNALYIKAPQTEITSTADALYNKDYLAVKIINKKDLNINVTQKEVKDFWQKHKNEFKTPEKYVIAIKTIPLNQEVDIEKLKNFYKENKNSYKDLKGEILSFEKAKERVKIDYLAKIKKKEAFLTYKKLKTEKNPQTITLTLQNDKLPFDKMQKLIENGYLKPFILNQEYVVAKLVKKISPQVMSFEEAKNLVEEIVRNMKLNEKLIKVSKESLKNFDGEIIGYVTKYDTNKIENLNPMEATEFLFTLFSLQKPKDFILIPNQYPQKSVIYNIIKQSFPSLNEIQLHKEEIIALIEKNVNNNLIEDLISNLSKRYKIDIYIKMQ